MPPVPVSVVLPPSQNEGVPLIPATGLALTVTVVIAVALQLPLLTVTVYMPDIPAVDAAILGFCWFWVDAVMPAPDHK